MKDETTNTLTLIEELISFGISRQEATVYIALLKKPGITGYEVGKQIGKPATNIYKLLLTLEAKGAVSADISTLPKTYIPVPLNEFLDQYEKKMASNRLSLEKKFEQLELNHHATGGIYPIKGMTRIWNKATEMVNSATTVIVVNRKGDLPNDFQLLLEEKKAKGVEVIIKANTEVNVAGSRSELYGPELKWDMPKNVEWLDVLIDGLQVLISFKSQTEQTPHAIWSDNQLLSFNLYNGQICEFFLSKLSRYCTMNTKTGFFKDLDDLEHLRASQLVTFKENLVVLPGSSQ